MERGVVPEVEVFADPAQLAEALARDVVAASRQAVEERGRFLLVLSGGSTPRPLYERLAKVPPPGIDWPHTEVFWGDERCVPPEDPRSNYGMALESLLRSVPVVPEHVHRIRGELPPEEGARHYTEEIRAVTGTNLPVFDLVILGLGDDGHTASLFPRSAELEEEQRPVVPVPVSPDEPRVPRITFTYPVFRASRRVWFLVSGHDKASIVARVLRSLPEGTSELPASRVRARGSTRWYLDSSAASIWQTSPSGAHPREVR